MTASRKALLILGVVLALAGAIAAYTSIRWWPILTIAGIISVSQACEGKGGGE